MQGFVLVTGFVAAFAGVYAGGAERASAASGSRHAWGNDSSGQSGMGGPGTTS